MTTSRRLRLAAVVDTAGWGGAEIVLVRVLQHLVRSWDVVLLATDPQVGARFDAEVAGVEVRCVPATDRPGGRGAQLRAVRHVRPDAALVNLNHPWAAPLLQVGALLARVPTVAVEHMPGVAGGSLGPRLKPWTSRRLSAHVCVGESAARRLEAIVGLPPGSVATIRNGVPWPRVTPLPLPEGLSRPCLTWVGRLSEQKGVDVLLAAVAQVPGLSLWIDGEGELEPQLRAQAAALGVAGRVCFAGWGPDPRGVLAAGDLVAFPTRGEAWSLVLVEAVQAGLPVVVTDLPETRELLRDVAVYVPLDDPDALAGALRRCLDDPDALAERRRASLALAETLPTVEQMAESYDLLLREAVRLGPGARVAADVLRALPAAPPG